MQATAVAISRLPELYYKTLLLKTSHALITVHGEIKVVPSLLVRVR